MKNKARQSHLELALGEALIYIMTCFPDIAADSKLLGGNLAPSVWLTPS